MRTYRVAWGTAGVLTVGAITAMLAAGGFGLVIRCFSVLMGLCWLYCTLFNGVVAWRVFVRGRKRGPSAIPLVGGICAYLGLMWWQLGTQHLGKPPPAYPLSLVPLSLILDYGSLPSVVLYGLPALWRRE